MKNRTFCYWLQGYFEICPTPTLTKAKVMLIQQVLNKIDEPLGEFTEWLSNLLNFFEKQAYTQSILDFFTKEIRQELDVLFEHVLETEQGS